MSEQSDRNETDCVASKTNSGGGIRNAPLIFSERGVDLTLFFGDMIVSGNCYAFQGFSMPIKLVYGNNDGDLDGPAREFSCRGGMAGDRLQLLPEQDQAG